MNDFLLFEQLCSIENILSQYRYGDICCKRTHELADTIKSRIYNVAVIGEFKRGKSSLINALVGSRILPTDILPMTASITRIKYGDEKRIVVQYKNGNQEEKSLDELVDFATKIDKEKEKKAESIKEVVVTYPSILCKNSIEIIDTPGMNDDEKMSAITLGILGDIDTAVMVISACSPLSVTEQNLIVRMIEEPGIRHIFFVITYIDEVSEDIGEQDRIIKHIKEKIVKDVLKRTDDAFNEDDILKKKAHAILSDPHINGVSSTLAMEGFISDDKRKLKLSRLPILKQELLDYLTSAQSIDAYQKTIEIIDESRQSIRLWFEEEYNELMGEKQRLIETKACYDEFFNHSMESLTKMISEMDACFESIGLLERYSESSNRLFRTVRRLFINNLATIHENNYSDESISRILAASYESAETLIDDFNTKTNNTCCEQINILQKKYLALRPTFEDALFEKTVLDDFISQFQPKEQTDRCPCISLNKKILNETQLKGRNVIEEIEKTLQEDLLIFGHAFEDFVASWRVLLLKYHSDLLKKTEILDFIAERLSSIELRLSAMKYSIDKDCERIDQIMKTVSEAN